MKFNTQLSGTYTRFFITAVSYKDLLEEILKHYKGKLAISFNLKYLDEENDLVVFSD